MEKEVQASLDTGNINKTPLKDIKFFSTHNSYITEKQFGGKVDNKYVVEQLKLLDRFPVCIELDILLNSPWLRRGKLEINHCSKKGEDLETQLNDLHNRIQDEVSELKDRRFPLVLSFDTTLLNINSGVYKTGCALKNFFTGETIGDIKRRLSRSNSSSMYIPHNNSKYSNAGGGMSAGEFRLCKLLFDSPFNEGDGHYKFFDYKTYFFKRLIEILTENMVSEDLKLTESDVSDDQKKKIKEIINNTDFNIKNEEKEGICKELIKKILKILSLVIEIDLSKDIPLTDELTEELYDLLHSYKSNTVSLHTPLEELMDTVLIRFKNSKKVVEENIDDTKILPMYAVHLNGKAEYKNTTTSTFIKSVDESKASTVYRIYPNGKKKIHTQQSISGVTLTESNTNNYSSCKREDSTEDENVTKEEDSKEKEKYKKENEEMLELNYESDYRDVNMIAFNWHDVCETNRKKLIEAFTQLYALNDVNTNLITSNISFRGGRKKRRLFSKNRKNTKRKNKKKSRKKRL
jgi:hypothetical protein